MRKTIPLAVICLGASLAFATAANIQPLKVKTGLWQMTEKVTWTGLPPQYAALLQNAVREHYKSCVKATDLIKNPWANGSGQRCTWTVLHSNGTDMEVQGSCRSENKGDDGSMQMQGKIHVVDSEHGTGSTDVTLTWNGMTAKGHATYTGKWIAATCPADMN